MNSEEFTEKLISLSPEKKQLIDKGFDLQFIVLYRESYVLKQTKFETITDNPVLDLIYKYNVNNLDIGMIRLENMENVLEYEKHIFFGRYDSDLLVIDKTTNEVILVDYEDEHHIMFRVSKSSESFLNVLIEVARFNKERLLGLGNSTDEDILKKANEIAYIAGGNDYLDFYLMVLGYETSV